MGKRRAKAFSRQATERIAEEAFPIQFSGTFSGNNQKQSRPSNAFLMRYCQNHFPGISLKGKAKP
jgi:hypothetical protein